MMRDLRMNEDRYASTTLARVGAAYLHGEAILPTTGGLVRAGTITPGMQIISVTGQAVTVARVLKRPATAAFPAILMRIAAGVLGAETDVRISHGNALLIDHWVCAPLFGEPRMLAYAADLWPAKGIDVEIITEGDIIQILLDDAALVSVQGLRLCLEDAAPFQTGRPPMLLPVLYPEESQLVGSFGFVMRRKSVATASIATPD